MAQGTYSTVIPFYKHRDCILEGETPCQRRGGHWGHTQSCLHLHAVSMTPPRSSPNTPVLWMEFPYTTPILTGGNTSKGAYTFLGTPACEASYTTELPPSSGHPSHRHTLSVRVPKNPAGCLCQTRHTSSSDQAPHPLQASSFDAQNSPVGSPFADGETEGEQ